MGRVVNQMHKGQMYGKSAPITTLSVLDTSARLKCNQQEHEPHAIQASVPVSIQMGQEGGKVSAGLSIGDDGCPSIIHKFRLIKQTNS